jgi:hypothetical protein
VEVMLNGHSLEKTFQITILPASPCRWKLIHDPELEIVGFGADDTDDFRQKIAGACWVDEFDNLVPCSDSTPMNPVLEMLIVEVGDEVKVEHKSRVDDVEPGEALLLTQHRPTSYSLPLVFGQLQLFSKTSGTTTSEVELSQKKGRKRRQPESGSVSMSQDILRTLDGYCLPPQAFELSKFVVGDQIGLRVVDKARKFQSSDLVCCPTVASLPSVVWLSCPKYYETAPAQQLSMKIPSNSNSVDISVHIVDSHGAEPNFNGISGVKIDIVGPNGQRVASKSNVVMSVTPLTLLYDFTSPMSNSTSNVIVEFECKVTFTRNRSSVALKPATVRCELLKFNNVIRLSAHAFERCDNNHNDLRCNSEVNSQGDIVSSMLSITTTEVHMRFVEETNSYHLDVQCGALVPTFSLTLDTDDGEPFLPDLDSFQVGCKLCVGKQPKEKKSFMDFLECEIDEEQNRMLFIPTNIFKSETLCTYELDIIYTEKRPGFAFLSADCKYIKIQLVVTFVPGAPHALKLDKNSVRKLSNRVVCLDSNNTKKHVIGESIRLHVEDRFGNVIRMPHDAYEIRCQIVAQPQLNAIIKLSQPNDEKKLILPRLKSDDNSGVVIGQWVRNDDACKFATLEPETCSTDEMYAVGTYSLHFSMYDKVNTNTSLMSTDSVFDVTTNERTQYELDKLQHQLNSLLETQQVYNEII